jgi:serine/threonine protein kinase
MPVKKKLSAVYVVHIQPVSAGRNSFPRLELYSPNGRGSGIAKDIAAGLHYLHSRSIVHMDLKSSNILLSNFGMAKIADVGLSKYQHLSYVRPDARQSHGGAPSNNYRVLAVPMLLEAANAGSRAQH